MVATTAKARKSIELSKQRSKTTNPTCSAVYKNGIQLRLSYQDRNPLSNNFALFQNFGYFFSR